MQLIEQKKQYIKRLWYGMFIKREAQKRKIQHIYHFTNRKNLDSILKRGIVPRAILEAQGIEMTYNDDFRYDYQTNANCLSIEHPNYKMFYKYRRDYPEEQWVVLEISADILWLKDCAFCYENAAKKRIAAIPIQDRKGTNAFRKLFESLEGMPDRSSLDIDENSPTNPQAEVLVFDTIEVKYIQRIVMIENRPKELEYLKRTYPDFHFSYDDDNKLRGPRRDYEAWKKPSLESVTQ